MATNCLACSGLPLKPCITHGCGVLPECLHACSSSFLSISNWSKAFTQCTTMGFLHCSAKLICALIASICTSMLAPRILSSPHSPMAHTSSLEAMCAICSNESFQLLVTHHGCMPADNAACLGKYAGVSLLPMLYRQGNESMMWVWMLNMFAECGRCLNKFSEHLLFQIDDTTEACHALLVIYHFTCLRSFGILFPPAFLHCQLCLKCIRCYLLETSTGKNYTNDRLAIMETISIS